MLSLRAMNILMAASEMSPFAKTGDYADAMLALPTELKKQGHEVSVVLPYYRCIRENKSLKAKRKGVNLRFRSAGADSRARFMRHPPQMAFRSSWSRATNILIAAASMVSMAEIIKTTPRALFSSQKRWWNSPSHRPCPASPSCA